MHWGNVNRPIDEAKFDALHQRHDGVPAGQGSVRPRRLGAAPTRSTGCRSASSTSSRGTTCSRATCSCPRTTPAKRAGAPSRVHGHRRAELQGRSRRKHGTRSDVFILVHFGKKLVLIGGTHYAGEIKKSIFTILNYMLPLQGVLSMHCSANIGADGDTALFFGLSGTGKTTLSSDPRAAADRRRRARLERHRRVQLRGRLLREGDQAVARGRAADLRDHAPLRHRPRERRASTPTRARSISTTRRSPRTRAARIRSTSSTTRCSRARAAIRRTSSC